MVDLHWSLRGAIEALETAKNSGDPHWAELGKRGSLRLGLYAPRGSDPQQPHAQDELYVVMQGHGHFQRGEENFPFMEGDVIFVAAGIEHRFVNFTDDFCCWVIFYGPSRCE